MNNPSNRSELSVVRVYHGGRSAAHRARDEALAAAGIRVTLVVPKLWPEGDAHISDEPSGVEVVELAVRRAGDVNRHSYANPDALARLLREVRPDLLDIHEEPFSLAARQWLAASPQHLPTVMYTAQNIDKRYPPPFAQFELAAHRRVTGLYACSAQAASVARGKGFAGVIDVVPLGYDDALFVPGKQCGDQELVLALFGRLVPEKGLIDAVRVLARVNESRAARLVVRGSGPDEIAGRELASRLGVADRVEISKWAPPEELAKIYRTAHFLLIPSRPTSTWVEQFGRVIVEAQASGAIVLGYDSGAIREVGGPAAALVAPGDTEALAERLLLLLSDPPEIERRRTSGLEASRQRTWTRVGEAHADLYRRVVDGNLKPIAMPRSPERRRMVARAEFGETARTPGDARPFALPYLRRGGVAASVLASTVDTVAEAVSHFREEGITSEMQSGRHRGKR